MENNIINNVNGKENIKRTENIEVTYKDGEKRNVYYELHINDGDPAEVAEIYRKEYCNKYLKYMRKDTHKYDNHFPIKKEIIGFAYVVAKDAENDQVLGFCACDIYKKKIRGKDIIASGTHCLCSLPKITEESSPDKGGRGCSLAKHTIEILYDNAFKEYNIDVDYEICNEFSNKVYTSYVPENKRWNETGVYRINKVGERCMIRSQRWFKIPAIMFVK